MVPTVLLTSYQGKQVHVFLPCCPSHVEAPVSIYLFLLFLNTGFKLGLGNWVRIRPMASSCFGTVVYLDPGLDSVLSHSGFMVGSLYE